MKKELYESFFKDKKVTVLGLGLLGRGMGDTEFLLQHGADVICTDTRSEEKLAESIAYIAKEKHTNLTLVIGENRLEDFENRDFVLTCTGMPVDYEYLKHAKENNIPVYMSAALVVKLVREKGLDVKVVGVTGTRGKSTATYLIDHIIRAAGMRVSLGGNVRGVANLPILEDIESGDVLLFELDSWQLQGFKDLRISPNIAVFTSFLDDHLNYYKGDREAYFNDKASIFVNQKVGDVLIASPQAHTEILKRGLGDDAIVPEITLRADNLIGEHNEVAVSLAHAVAKSLGIADEVIHEAIKTFKPVPGRLEYVGDYRGVHVYNDNNATTPDATIAAIHAINKKYNKKPIVIVGGSDKGLDLTSLEKEIESSAKAYILLAGTGTEKLKLSKENLFETLDECIKKSFEVATEGDVVLFSPGFASFSKYFKNEYERHDMFVSGLSLL